MSLCICSCSFLLFLRECLQSGGNRANTSHLHTARCCLFLRTACPRRFSSPQSRLSLQQHQPAAPHIPGFPGRGVFSQCHSASGPQRVHS